MRDTTITILRGGNNNPTNILVGLDNRNATGIYVQVDQADDKELALMQQVYQWYGKIGFKIKTHYWNANALIKQDDILVDERFTDPDTGALYRYHVVGRPRDFSEGPYAGDHQEVFCDVPVGT